MQSNPVFDFQGIDHIALTVSDMKQSVEFYNGKLGMPVLHTLEYANPEGEIIGQHWFMGVGDPANPDAHIGLFCWKGGYQTLTPEEIYSGKKPPNKFAKPIGSMIHLNFKVDADKLQPYAQKLSDIGLRFRQVTRYATDESELQNSGLVNVGMRGITTWNEYHQPEEGWLMNSIYIFDPDGIEIEFNAWSSAWRDWPAKDIAKPRNEFSVA